MMATALIFLAVTVVAAMLILFILVKFLGCAVAPFIGNIIAGGALYVFLDAFHIIKMDWSVFDAIIVALFGVPGTIFLAVLEFF